MNKLMREKEMDLIKVTADRDSLKESNDRYAMNTCGSKPQSPQNVMSVKVNVPEEVYLIATGRGYKSASEMRQIATKVYGI